MAAGGSFDAGTLIAILPYHPDSGQLVDDCEMQINGNEERSIFVYLPFVHPQRPLHQMQGQKDRQGDCLTQNFTFIPPPFSAQNLLSFCNTSTPSNRNKRKYFPLANMDKLNHHKKDHRRR